SPPPSSPSSPDGNPPRLACSTASSPRSSWASRYSCTAASSGAAPPSPPSAASSPSPSPPSPASPQGAPMLGRKQDLTIGAWQAALDRIDEVVPPSHLDARLEDAVRRVRARAAREHVAY